jgi:hypothetical protein
VAVGFTREIGDESLDRALRLLHGDGARILSCETERATLLDVIERYESEDENSGADGAAEVKG